MSQRRDETTFVLTFDMTMVWHESDTCSTAMTRRIYTAIGIKYLWTILKRPTEYNIGVLSEDSNN